MVKGGETQLSTHAHYHIFCEKTRSTEKVFALKVGCNGNDALNDPNYCTRSPRHDVYPIVGGTPAAVFAVNPGLCHSQILREAVERPVVKYLTEGYKAILSRTTEVGSRTLVHAVTDPNERTFHAHYVSTCNVVEESDYLRTVEGKALTERAWNETLEILEGIDHRVKQFVSEYLSSPVDHSA
ncbi:hypothetical protein BKA93DRAFT_750625 [Sparassis latifolia]